jgi:hypothetical protein
MSCLPEVQGYSGIGTGRGADVAAPYNYGGNFKGLLVRCLNCNASRLRGGDPSMRILVRNAGRWFGPRSVGPGHSAFPLARTNGPRLCDCASENDRDLPDSEARALIGRGARAGNLKSRVRARIGPCFAPTRSMRQGTSASYATAPPGRDADGASRRISAVYSAAPSVAPISHPQSHGSKNSIPGLQLAKTLPGLAVETHELHLIDRNVIAR